MKNAGSFIRPTSHLVYGVSFLTALTSKYVEELHGSDTQEKVVLGSSQGTIEVEAVSLDKVRQKFARLDQLREISLEYANVVKGDEPGRILESCPSMLSIHIFFQLRFFQCISADVRGLDLSSNLCPSWEAIAEITRELTLLRRLSLKYVITFGCSADAELAPPFQSKPITTSLKLSVHGRSLSKCNGSSVKCHILELDRDANHHAYHAEAPTH